MNVTNIIIYSVILFLTLVLSFCYSATDMAYSAVQIARLRKTAREGDKRSQKALRYAKNYDKTIATVLFGNDFVNILSSSICALLFTELLSSSFDSATIDVIATMSLLVVLLLFCEITPKAIAKSHSYALSRAMVPLLRVCSALFFPFVYPINRFVAFATSRLVEAAGPEPMVASDDELDAMVEEIHKEGILDKEQTEMLHKTIEFKETSCYEVMTPRVDVTGYDADEPFDEFLKDKAAFRHSRIIVYRENLDHILGFIPVKTLLRALAQKRSPKLEDFLTPVLSVPRTMPVSSAMALMKSSRRHIAVVRDEFGGTEGIITLEDILEEIVGEMWDENDAPEVLLTRITRDSYLVKGKMNISDFFRELDIDPDFLDEDYTTVSGFIVDRLGRFAAVGDRIKTKHLTFLVTEVDDYTVKTVKVTRRRGKDHE